MNEGTNRAVVRWKVVLACALVNGAALADVSISKDDHRAAQRKIEQALKVEKQACGALQGNARDMCMTEAKGRAHVALAELQADYQPSPESQRDAKQAKAKASYAATRERCNNAAGAIKAACLQRAKASFESAMRISKVERVRATNALKAKEREDEEARIKATRQAPAAASPARAASDAGA